MAQHEDSSVREWWRNRLMTGISLEENPEMEVEFRLERNYWCRWIADDAAYLSYSGQLAARGEEPVDYPAFIKIFHRLVPNCDAYPFRTIRRRDLVTGEWPVEVESDIEGVHTTLAGDLDDCRRSFEWATNERPEWPATARPERARMEALAKCAGDITVPMWWWWKLRRGETVVYFGDWRRIEWNREPGINNLFSSYLNYCKWIGVDAPLGMVHLNSHVLLPSTAFRRAFARLLPGRRIVPFEGTFRLPARKRSKTKRHLGDRVDVFECVFLPRLTRCRKAFEAAAGIGPQDWDDAVEQEFDVEPDYAGVAEWWGERLDKGVTVPDDGSPYGHADLFWNRTPSRRMMMEGYRDFCSRNGRTPLDEKRFAAALAPLLQPPRDRWHMKVMAPVFLREEDSRPESTPRLVLAPCFRLPCLKTARQVYDCALGTDRFCRNMAEACANWSVAARSMTPRGVFLLWLQRLLSRAGVLCEDDLEETPGSFRDHWPLFRDDLDLCADYMRFCVERGIPAKMKKFNDWIDDVAGTTSPLTMSLPKCRKRFKQSLGRKVEWPVFHAMDSGDEWADYRSGIYWEERLSKDWAVHLDF